MGETKKLRNESSNFASRIRDHVNLGSKLSETVMGKLRLGARIIQEGGRENMFKQTFGMRQGEELLKASQCYLSTTAGPIAGLLFISTEKVAFLSESPVTISSPTGHSITTDYKVLIPIKKIKTGKESENMKKAGQKYLLIVTKDEYEFWFMGFLRFVRGRATRPNPQVSFDWTLFEQKKKNKDLVDVLLEIQEDDTIPGFSLGGESMKGSILSPDHHTSTHLTRPSNTQNGKTVVFILPRTNIMLVSPTRETKNAREMRNLRRERGQSSENAAIRLCLGRQLMLPSSTPDSAFDAVAHIKVGSYYEIDHSKLPPKIPDQLKLVRVIMVPNSIDLHYKETHLFFCFTIELRFNHGFVFAGFQVSKKFKGSVSLRYPSVFSLRAHFSERNRRKPDTKMLPSFDEQYALLSELAGDILYRRIPPHEIALHRNEWSFWVIVTSSCDQETGQNSSPLFPILCPSRPIVANYVNMVPKNGLCWYELKSKEMVRWGRRKQSQQITLYSPSKKKGGKNPIDRWSFHRYHLAEENMLKIMKEKGAVFGNPILRPALRAEARKLIGDTGLLDHLLKHMAGKLAPGGEERFMRRHNSDGAMEYWLESAGLMEIRKEAGVEDPYWTPPPGWKLGDNPNLDPVCAKELKELREEVDKLKRCMLEITEKPEEDIPLLTTPSSSVSSQYLVSDLLALKGNYVDLMNKKSKIEKQLMLIAKSLCALEEETGKLECTVEDLNKPESAETRALILGSATPPLGTEKEMEKTNKAALVISDKEEKDGKAEEKTPRLPRTKTKAVAATEDKAAKIERLKSGFRICKPQGTFLWPNMNKPHSQALVPIDDLFKTPTPPSVGSSTTTAPLLLPSPQPTNTTVKPLAERRSTLPQVATNSTSTVINLNEVPGNPHDNVFSESYSQSHTSPSHSQLTYRRRYHHATPSLSSPRSTPAKRENEVSQPSSHRVSVGAAGNWLALSTSSSSLDKNPKEGLED
ncbi:hypothetical protein COLO4_14079 [Corchorus olitorius]|uniref:GRAM domain-containing protein n=1 Tax=Corchorus olitorius TaxID=93759 RepID=A0A1R3JTT6_9ROSI|nr:hypothetical protein COLO4_14079 [Corchorus olitorius]